MASVKKKTLYKYAIALCDNGCAECIIEPSSTNKIILQQQNQELLVS
jgi:hypothetical protein